MKERTRAEIINEINGIEMDIWRLLEDGGYLNHWEELYNLEYYKSELEKMIA